MAERLLDLVKDVDIVKHDLICLLIKDHSQNPKRYQW
jgi:hypothetical protein